MNFTKEEIELYSDVVCGTIDNIIRELLIKYEKSIFNKKYYKKN